MKLFSKITVKSIGLNSMLIIIFCLTLSNFNHINNELKTIENNQVILNSKLITYKNMLKQKFSKKRFIKTIQSQLNGTQPQIIEKNHQTTYTFNSTQPSTILLNTLDKIKHYQGNIDQIKINFLQQIIMVTMPTTP